MASDPSTQSRVVFQTVEKTEEPAQRKLGKLTVKYNRKDLQRRLEIEEWIDGQLHLLFDCEVRWGWLTDIHTYTFLFFAAIFGRHAIAGPHINKVSASAVGQCHVLPATMRSHCFQADKQMAVLNPVPLLTFSRITSIPASGG